MNLHKRPLTALLVSAALSLVACGGDDDDSSVYQVNPDGTLTPGGAVAVNTGKATAAFVPGPHAAFVVAGLGNLVSSSLESNGSDIVQIADGAATTLGGVSLKDVVTVNEISGDSTFAMGRWSRGRISSSSINMLLDGAAGRSYHYLAYNKLSTTTATTPRICDAGTFTAPSVWNSGTVPAGTSVGVTTGSATMAWLPATATDPVAVNVKLTFTTTANGSSQMSTYEIKALSTKWDGFNASGLYFAQGPGAAMFLGDAGNGAVAIGALYRVLLPNGLTYEGIMKFRCA